MRCRCGAQWLERGLPWPVRIDFAAQRHRATVIEERGVFGASAAGDAIVDDEPVNQAAHAFVRGTWRRLLRSMT